MSDDVKTPYQRRYAETSSRSLEENTRLYDQRSSQGKDTGILTKVINEQRSEQLEEQCQRRRDEYGHD